MISIKHKCDLQYTFILLNIHKDISAQERHGLVRASPEKSHQNDEEGEAALLKRQPEKAGAGEEQAPGRPCCSLPVLKEGL